MDSLSRGRYQGVYNIVRFNWHFYAIAGSLIILLAATAHFLDKLPSLIYILATAVVLVPTLISLMISYYVYDVSSLYQFNWLRGLNRADAEKVLNIHAGFDETSHLIAANFRQANLEVYDFYDPEQHTEVSIERARRAYPPFPRTIKITTRNLPARTNSADLIFNIFALHEIRNSSERIQFLQDQVRVLKNNGIIIIVEHTRDLANFLAYNIGFMHFFPESEWTNNFARARLTIERRHKITSFITVFILAKQHGDAP